MKKFYWLGLGLGYSLLSYSQDTLKQKNLNEVFIYSSKFAEKKKNIAQKIEVISSQQIALGTSRVEIGALVTASSFRNAP